MRNNKKFDETKIDAQDIFTITGMMRTVIIVRDI